MNFTEHLTKLSLISKPKIIIGALLATAVGIASVKTVNRIKRRNREKYYHERLDKKVDYLYYIQQHLSRMGLSVDKTDWDKMAINYKKIENLLKFHSLITEEKVEKVPESKIFYNLLHKYFVFSLKDQSKSLCN